MKRAHFYCLTVVVILLFFGISMVSMAEVAVLKLEIFRCRQQRRCKANSTVTGTLGGSKRHHIPHTC